MSARLASEFATGGGFVLRSEIPHPDIARHVKSNAFVVRAHSQHNLISALSWLTQSSPQLRKNSREKPMLMRWQFLPRPCNYPGRSNS